METTLRRYGNSTVVALPTVLLKKLGLQLGQPLKLDTTGDGKIVMTAVPITPNKRKYTLDELVAQCDTTAPKPADMELWDAAKPVGGDAW